MSQKPREIAVRLLLQNLQRGTFIEQLTAQALRQENLSGPDAGLLQEITYGVVRWQRTLQWLIQRKSQKVNKPIVTVLLELGLYQLFWLERIPDHAAVHETVELAGALGAIGQKGFINAVLRAYIREREPTRALLQKLKQENPPLGNSHPDWLYQRWKERWNAEAASRLMECNNIRAQVFARRNTLKISAAELEAKWHQEGLEFIARAFDWVESNTVYELRHPTDIERLASWSAGCFYLQDPSTLLAVSLLNPAPASRVLDLCAAPGGKTTALWAAMKGEGTLVASDLSDDRLELLRQNCERMGTTANIVKQKDLAALEPFDYVLLDAPCSNTGVIRRRIDLRWRVKPDELRRLAGEQSALLNLAESMVKPGGSLVYSTCSLEREENEGVVSDFLQRHSSWTSTTERQLIPNVEGVDGAYTALLKQQN